MSASLPSFSSLLAFDAAARHGTFTRAARELNVSQPAISRRVAMLEADIGVALFDRTTKPMQLTPEGISLFDVLRSGLSRLETTISDLRESAGNRKFTIAADPGFLTYWLLPRFQTLRAAFPELNFSFMTGDYRGAASNFDVLIRFGTGAWDGLTSSKVLGEEVYPVCAPVFLEDRDPNLDPLDIQSSRLLLLADSFQRWYDWKAWLAAAGVPTTRKLQTIEFDSYATVINAALAGQGIALCWAGLLEDFLETGALVRVSDVQLVSDRGYFVYYDEALTENSAAARVAAWFSELGRD